MSGDREPVSAFIICYNEEDHIAECIDSVAFCDEVIVVDSFSTDLTVQIATEKQVKIIQRKWTGYISQKAWALENTKHRWVINLDADERVSPELRENIERVLREVKASGKEPEVVGYYVNRVVFYLGRWWRLGGWYPEYRLRFFMKDKVRWGGVEPHDRPIATGKTENLAGELHHFTYDNMDEQFLRLHNYSSIAAREEFRAGKRSSIAGMVANPVLRTLKFYFLKRGYREGVAGLIVAIAEGYYTFMKYAKLWEQSHLQEHRRDATPAKETNTRRAAGE